MRRSTFVKPLAVITSLLLGAGIIWYQAGLIRGEPAAAPAAELTPESRADSLGDTDHASETAEPGIEGEEPGVHLYSGQQYFSTSKSIAPPALFRYVPPPTAAPNAPTGEYFHGSKSAQPIIPIRGSISGIIPWVPSESADEPTQQSADETDE